MALYGGERSALMLAFFAALGHVICYRVSQSGQLCKYIFEMFVYEDTESCCLATLYLYICYAFFSSDRLKPQESLFEMMPPLWTISKSVPLRFSLSGLLIPISHHPSTGTVVMKMCPPLTVKNWQHYQPLIAIGCANGTVQICDVAYGLVRKELAVHNYAVKGSFFIFVSSRNDSFYLLFYQSDTDRHLTFKRNRKWKLTERREPTRDKIDR